ncbi:MAG TPA: DsrH/TusB family sulfur metabolism protein [Moraxellaceae bacterium]|nr:DsrH/TusB family sulfur metabolism protein [Moraxellaceae bacterium]
MTTLHIVHRLEGGRLPGALGRSMAGNDTLLLTGEGVYAALADAGGLPADCVALEADVRARGLLPQWPAHLPLIDHGGFVDLVVRHGKSLSWG